MRRQQARPDPPSTRRSSRFQPGDDAHSGPPLPKLREAMPGVAGQSHRRAAGGGPGARPSADALIYMGGGVIRRPTSIYHVSQVCLPH